MKVAVIGGGGREDAIIKKIRKNKKITKIYAIPGNGGIDAVCVNISPTDIDGIVNYVKKEGIEFVIVAPDDPLVLGLVNRLEEINVKTFGPRKEAAIIEGSKSFAKDLMKKYNIPTAKYEIFSEPKKAKEYIKSLDSKVVIKADGLALGKGVIIPETKDEAIDAIDEIMVNKKFGKSGDKVVIEEFLEGVEVSVLALTDGETLIPLSSSMDHKRALDNDKGLNTGGMGTIAPNPYYTEKIEKEAMERIFIPTIKAMREEGRKFKGCLYFGLMLTKEGPKVIEYNCRFGDPETQVVLPLLESDLFEIMEKIYDDDLKSCEVKLSSKSCCCLVLAAKGYPVSYEKGNEITFSNEIRECIDFAGVKKVGNTLVTNGGRVLGLVAVGNNLKEAIDKAYQLESKVDFIDKYCRKDIGLKALKA